MNELDERRIELLRCLRRKFLAERIRLRRSLRLNKPKPPRGLARIVAEQYGRAPHSLFCQCLDCIPLSLRPEFAPLPDEPEALPLDAPVVAIPVGKSIYTPPKRKWTQQRGRSSN